MEHNQKQSKTILDTLGALDDDRLKAAVGQIAAAIGASESQIRAVTGDMTRVKSVLGGLNDKDLKQMEKQLGREKLKQLQDLVEEQAKGE